MVKRGKAVKSEHSSSLWKKHALGGGRLLVAFSIPLLFSWFIASSVIVPTIIPNTSATESTEKNTSTSTTDKGYSLSISVPKSVTIDLTPTPSGSFSYSELNTNVTTTNPTGYSLSFNASDNGNTNANELINTNTNITTNNTIPSITNDINQSNFPTNSWGYSINDNNANIESLTFKPIPLPSSSAQDKQLKVTSIADNSTTPTANTNTKLIIGLKADNNLAAGDYQGQLTFSVVANAPPIYNLAYDKNNTTYNPATSVSGTMNTADDLEKYNTYTLASNNYTRPGYRFLGWSTSSSATTATYTNAQSLTEAQVNTLTGSAATGSTITLYAIWQPQNQLTTITNMQQMTASICSNTYTPTASATTTTTSQYFSANNVPEKILTDTRDNNTYVVRKLADGKCWMTQNLRLGTQALPSAASASSNITLTSANSNVSSNFTIPTSAIQTSGYTDWSHGSVSSSSAWDVTHVYNNGNSWIAPTSEGNASTVNTTGTPPNQSQYIGNYYNWYTATAGTGIASMSSGNASSSICPKGWKLPTGSANSDITGLTGALVNITTNNTSAPTQSFTMQSAPNYFVLSGYYVYGVGNQGSYGYWWSSTAYSSTSAYRLALSTLYVLPQNGSAKDAGSSVRCVAQ